MKTVWSGLVAVWVMSGMGPELGASVLYVTTQGDDATAVPDRPDKPFRSVGAALSQIGDGDTVLIGGGTYTVTPGYPSYKHGASLTPLQLINRSDVTIAALGTPAEIRGGGRGDFLMIENCTNVVVRNLNFLGDRPMVIAADYPLFGMIMLRGLNRQLRFERCRFEDFGNHGITHLYDPKSSQEVTVSGCYFLRGGALAIESVGEDGAAVSGIGSGWLIESNVVDCCVRGFEIEGADGTEVTNVVIRGNHLTNTFNLGIMLFATGRDSTQFRDIRIENNLIADTYPGSNDHAVGVLITGGENITVVSNRVERTHRVAIAMNASFADLKNSRIVDNVVCASYGRGIQCWQEAPYTAENILIAGNRVQLAGEAGILLNASNVEVTRNHLTANAMYSVGAGIEIAGAARSILVHGNTIENDPTGSPTQNYGVWLRPGTVSTIVRSNTITRQAERSVLNEGHGTDLGLLLRSIDASAQNDLCVRAIGVPESEHVLEFSTNLTTWATLSHQTSDSNGSVEFIVPSIETNSNQFFRLRYD